MAPPSDLPKMQYRFLGQSGLKVSAISIGGWLTYGGSVQDEKTFEIMKAAYDVGINFFDCAEGYEGGKSETVMGKAIKKYGWKRNDIVVSTKLYWGGANGDNPVNNGGLSRKHIIEGCDASLKRLQLDYVDLIYAHRPDRQTPLEETVRAFNHLINTGKAFYWGTSEWSAQEISAAAGIADRLGLIRPLMEQPQYNMLSRDKVEQEFSLLYDSQNGGIGLGLTPFSPLKIGILTGKYNDGIPDDSRLSTTKDEYIENLKKEFGNADWQEQLQIVRNLKPVADKLGATQAALALAWCIRNPRVSSAITGASRVDQVYKSLEALTVLPKLTDEIMEEIDGILKNKPTPLTLRFF